MKVIASLPDMQSEADRLRREGSRIAVVPTMGSLHRGHTSLIERARRLADVVVTTIFVNQAQFGPSEDYARYPRDFAHDRTLAEQAGTDIVFAPEAADMYPPGYQTFVTVEGVSGVLEGRFRPTHFRGVTTVVTKLFLAVKPHVAVFGQKDAQQAFIIRQMVRDLNIDTEIVVEPIIRDEDGLALSSRNVYLSADERRNALVLPRSLKHAEERIRSGERSVERLRAELTKIISGGHPASVDYIAFLRPESFTETDTVAPPGVLIAVAACFGTTRLIDNILVTI
jgi:pantoate--beta-alanine ligase